MERNAMAMPRFRRELIDTFGGYNHNTRIGDGEFFDMENLSGREYPLLAPRKKRGLYTQSFTISGMICKDALCCTDGGNFVVNGNPVPMELTPGSKQLISMGAYVIILPDKKYINTSDLTEYGSIEASFSGSLRFAMCTLDGTELESYVSGDQEPQEPQEGQLWLDRENKTLKKWSAASGLWVQVSTYVKISGTGIGNAFAVYDGVCLEGLQQIRNGQEDHSELKELTQYQVVWGKGEDYIIVTGLLSRSHTDVAGVTVSRRMPEMDYVVEYGNRLWGCRYGLQNGEFVNQLYASKLGDFKNWNCYMGTANDSWWANLGTDGQFTGAVSYLGHPLFFKEGCLHKVYPAAGGDHQVTDIALRGVQAGCARSLAMVGEVLYYKARGGVCAYDGALPTDISKALGNEQYDEAAAGVLGKLYYISMRSVSSGRWEIFVYDTHRKLWHREDSVHLLQFCNCREELYALDTGGRILAMGGSGTAVETDIPWMAQTGMIGLSLPDRKYINRLLLRISMPEGAVLTGWAEYDSSGKWVQVFRQETPGTGSFVVPIRPVRCDHMRLRLEGTGDIRVFSVTKQICQGSDR